LTVTLRQILTDLRRGGLAIYLGERAQSSGILMCKVLADMNQLWNFVNDALKELHGKLDGKGFADIDRLENPVRLRYILTSMEVPVSPSVCLERFYHCFYQNDVACLEDLEGFPELESEDSNDGHS